MEKEGEMIKLSDLKKGIMYAYLPNGKDVSINLNSSKEEALAQLEVAKLNYDLGIKLLAVRQNYLLLNIFIL